MTERLVSISTIVFAAFFLMMSLQIESRSGDQIGPGSWPIALMFMMLVFGITLTVNVFRKKNAEKQSSKNKDVVDEEEALLYPSNFYFMLLALAVYIVSLYYVGFIVSTLVLIFFLTFLFGMKKWLMRFITSVASTSGFVLLFPILLSMPFPRGVGIFREFTRFFY